MKLTKLIWIFLLVLPIVYAGGYMEYASIGWVKSNFCSIFGCTMQGDLDMGGYDILNATMVNVNRTNSTEVCINGVCIDSWLWNRTGTTLIPANDGDIINTTGTGSSFGGLTDTSIADTQVVYSNSNRLTGDAGLTFASGTGTLSATEFVGGGAGLTGLASYWDRTGTVLSPITAGDNIATAGALTLTGTNTGLLDLSDAQSDTTADNDYQTILKLSNKRGGTGYTASGLPSGFSKLQGDEVYTMWVPSASYTFMGAGVANDDYLRIRMQAGGAIQWGSGAVAPDTGLSRGGTQFMLMRGNVAGAWWYILDNTNANAAADVGLGFRIDGSTKWTIDVDKTDNSLNFASPYGVANSKLKISTAGNFDFQDGNIDTTGTGTFGDATIGNGYTGNCINTIFVSGIATGCND